MQLFVCMRLIKLAEYVILYGKERATRRDEY